MSRIRSIKPEFWTSEQVMNCNPCARLLFIGLWNFADDHGIYPASYLKLKAEVFPADPFSMSDICEWMNQLIGVNLVHSYEAQGAMYWIITGWEKHQKVDKPTYKYPPPDDKSYYELYK